MSSFDDRNASDQIAPVLSFPEGEILDISVADNESRSFDGPLSKAMWEKVSGLNSRYPDTFDWSVYDRLYNKFGATQPRGGVVFKTTLKLVNYHPTCNQCHCSPQD